MKKNSRYLIVIIILSVIWTILVVHSTLNGWWHKPVTTKKDTASLIAAVEEITRKEFVGNLVMAVMKDGKPEREFYFSNNKPADRTTVFQVSSLSKFVSATGIMKLAESGIISLDTPVNRYLKKWQLPESAFDNEKVTARRLLSHTAGLTDDLGYNGFGSRDSVQTLTSSLTKATDADEGVSGAVKVGIEPGSRWKYSGGGFTLLQLIVEETSGQTFNSFMTENLFKPLNMHSSTYLPDDSLNHRLCEFYNADQTPASHRYYTSLAATSLYTSLADLETFFQLFFKDDNGQPAGKGVLSPATLKSMRESHWDIMGERIFGLGCMLYIDIDDNEDIFGHDGKSTPPINTAIRMNPVTGDGIIVLETGNPDLATRIASDWVFLQTGKTDTLLFTMLMGKMIRIIIIGIIVIIIVTLATGFRLQKRKKR